MILRKKHILFVTCTILMLAILAYVVIFSHAKRSVATVTQNDSDFNVILISIDSLRADHLSAYGYTRKTSPNIDQLAKEGVLFSKAFTTGPWTLPAHMSMITSLYSEAHGVFSGRFSLDPKRITLAEILKSHGYHTAAFVSGPYMNSVYGFDQGFDVYDDSINGTEGDPRASPNRHGHKMVTSRLVSGAAKKWLSMMHPKKFFLFLHYFDVHYDYVPPAPYDSMFDSKYAGKLNGSDFARNDEISADMSDRDLAHVLALYDGEIAFTDHQIGEILSFLKQKDVYEKTLIVVTADHGEEFFEHGQKGHKLTLYDEVLRVPLIFKFPQSSKQNVKVERIVSLVDIMPTILGSLNIRCSAESQGRNLLSFSEPRNAKLIDDSVIYSRLLKKYVAVRSLKAKLIHHLQDSQYEFYDLLNDPSEKKNLLEGISLAQLPDARQKSEQLLNWMNLQSNLARTLPKANKTNKVNLNEGLKEQLKSLGYIQ